MDEQDYSDVAWPWDGDPNWAAPRDGATYGVGDAENWTLACGVCALHFPMEIRMQVVADHWDELHADEHGSSDDGALHLNLVWIGLGTPPKPPEGMPGG